MRTHFISRLALLLGAGFLVVVSQVWSGGTLQWIFAAGGLVMILVAMADAMRPTLEQRRLDGLIVLLGAWTIAAAFLFEHSNLMWWSFANGCALAALSVIGLVAHEWTTEKVVHELRVTSGRAREHVTAT